MTVEPTEEIIRKAARHFAKCNLRKRYAMRLFDTWYISVAIANCQGNTAEAAKLLGIERGTLHRLMRLAEDKKTTVDGA